MRTTVTLDDALLAQAQSLSGLKDRSLLLQEALRALIERESARRLIRLAPNRNSRTSPDAGNRLKCSWSIPRSG